MNDPATGKRNSAPLRVAPALRRFARALMLGLRRGDGGARRLARRRAVLEIVVEALDAANVDTVGRFESLLNTCMDLGYHARPLAAFAFEVLEVRLASRARRRLASAGVDPQSPEVADLVATAGIAISQLIREARREQHSVRYGLLISFVDHRTLDYLRRRRPVYSDTLDERAGGIKDGDWLRMERAANDPERELLRSRRRALGLRLRGAVLDAVNALPLAQRTALIMVEIHGLGYDDVAESLEIKRTDVGNLVRRARQGRDRLLSPLLRAMPGLEGHLGHEARAGDRALRRQMLSWSAEAGMGLCQRCLGQHHVHPAEEGCQA